MSSAVAGPVTMQPLKRASGWPLTKAKRPSDSRTSPTSLFRATARYDAMKFRWAAAISSSVLLDSPSLAASQVGRWLSSARASPQSVAAKGRLSDIAFRRSGFDYGRVSSPHERAVRTPARIGPPPSARFPAHPWHAGDRP